MFVSSAGPVFSLFSHSLSSHLHKAERKVIFRLFLCSFCPFLPPVIDHLGEGTVVCVRGASVGLSCNVNTATHKSEQNQNKIAVKCGILNSWNASHDNWCTGTLLNRMITAQWEGMGDVGSARYAPAPLSPCLTIRVLSYSNCPRSIHSISKWTFKKFTMFYRVNPYYSRNQFDLHPHKLLKMGNKWRDKSSFSTTASNKSVCIWWTKFS